MLHAIGSFKDVAHLSAHGYLRTLLTFIARSVFRGCSDSCEYDIVFSARVERIVSILIAILMHQSMLVSVRLLELSSTSDIQRLCQIRRFVTGVRKAARLRGSGSMQRERLRPSK